MKTQRVINNSIACSTRLLMLVCLCMAAMAQPGVAQTSAWPTKPVRIVTGWTPGGNADSISRLLADSVKKRTPHSVIVDNRPGAAGTIGALAVALAEPNGHTLLIATMVEVTVVPPLTVQSMKYDPEVDLQPVTQIGRWPMVLVAAGNLAPGTMAELVAYAKANAGKVNYGSLGVGTINHLTGELLNLTAGISAAHVPYKGGSPMLTDLAGGQVQFAFDSLGSTLPLIRAGKIKPLAITGAQRLATIGTVPTTAEAGFPDVVTEVWIGLFAPGKTPKNVISQLHTEALLAVNSPEMRKALEDREIQPVSSTPEEFKNYIQVETLKKRQLAARIGIKAE